MAKRYMPQDVFDGAALTVAMAKALGQDGQAIAEQLATAYGSSYADGNLVQQWDEASNKVLTMIPKLFSISVKGEKVAQVCKTLSRAITQFRDDGRRRRKGFFGGTLFNYEKSELPDKVSKFEANVAVYHVLLVTGAIDVHKLN
jgi:hypothetical protein